MAISVILNRRISDVAKVAARLDRFILESRNDFDGSYGDPNNEASRITLSLAVLQWHIAKGLSLESPRLFELAEWLRARNSDSEALFLAPLRLSTAAAMKTAEAEVLHDIAATELELRSRTSAEFLEKPVLIMVSIESLSLFRKIKPGSDLNEAAVSALKTIISESTRPLGLRAYAVSLLNDLGNDDERAMAHDKAKGLVTSARMIRNDLCIVDLAYLIINLNGIIRNDAKINSFLFESAEKLRNACRNGRPESKLIIHVPEELSQNENDRDVYAAAIIGKALLKLIGTDEHAWWQFAHAAWQDQINELENKLSKINTTLTKKDSQIEALSKEKNRLSGAFWILFGISVFLIILPVALMGGLIDSTYGTIIAVVFSIPGLVHGIRKWLN